MSFQHFRLGDISLQQPPSALQQPSTSSFPAAPQPPAPQKQAKQPYGSGDSDDGYTLVFPNLAAFNQWRLAEEERQMVEFVKGDTHGSKAVPPRFKDHTKLVCARHTRSGRKKYVKKHPERIRKVPSRKLEGVGCLASISYKTYHDTEEVRACYNSQHSHEIGLANLPFTRRGRKLALQRERENRNSASVSTEAIPHPSGSATAAASSPAGASTAQVPPSASTSTQATAMPPPHAPPPQNPFASAVSLIAPLPTATMSAQPSFHQPTSPSFIYQAQAYAPSMTHHPGLAHDRWENMSTLFQSIREHARTFEYPTPSVAALESVLIRLYLESPMAVSPQTGIGPIMQNGLGATRSGPSAPPTQTTSMIQSHTSQSPIATSTSDEAQNEASNS